MSGSRKYSALLGECHHSVNLLLCSCLSPIFQLARVLVRFDHIAWRIVNADHTIMRITKSRKS